MNETMKLDEVVALFQPKVCESQVEFEEAMQALAYEQRLINYPLEDDIEKLNKQVRSIELEKHALNAQQMSLRNRISELQDEKKSINRAIYQLKHDWCIVNPRDKFIKPEALDA